MARPRLSHRSRLVMVAAGSAGILFLAFFGFILWGLGITERKWASDELNASIAQVQAAIERDPGHLGLAFAVAANPEVSLAVLDSKGEVVASSGSVALTGTMPDGMNDIAGTEYYLASRRHGSNRILAALNWTNHQVIIDRFITIAMIMLCPLIAVVGFATWAAARATFKPLQQLAHEAEDIGVKGLNARMQTDDSDEYRDFVESLNALLDRVQASIKREERFLADAAHELRTPLTILRGRIETTLAKSRAPDEYRESLDVLYDEVRRMSDLVELILRSAANVRVTRVEADLAVAAERAHARWVDQFEEKQLRLLLEVTSVRVKMLEAECDVVLNNLLSNSLRASTRGGTCKISVENRGEVGVASVTDEGPGIEDDEMPYVFDFDKEGVTGRPKTGGGFGIGLQLCKRIVEGRNGRIWVEPNKPFGCIFRFECPILSAEELDATPPEAVIGETK